MNNMNISKNLKAFLDMIAFSEIGEKLLAISDDGYDVVVGSTPKKPILLDHYDDCNRKVINLGGGLKSTASGRYQILARYYDAYKKQLGLPDFSPESQDAIAIQLIKECKAIDDIEEGNIEEAIHKCRSRWASFPNAGYGQHENKLHNLIVAYNKSLNEE